MFDLRSDKLRPNGWTSADAAGLPITAGLVRPAEIKAGHIDHALRFTVEHTQRGYIHPATHQAGSTLSARRAADGRAVPAQGLVLAARLPRRGPDRS